MYFRFTGDIQLMHPCPRLPLPHAQGSVIITLQKERLAWRAFVKGHITSVTILLNGVECAMATPSAENLNSSGPSAASDVIKCVVLFRERGTRGNNFNRKEKLRAVLNQPRSQGLLRFQDGG